MNNVRKLKTCGIIKMSSDPCTTELDLPGTDRASVLIRLSTSRVGSKLHGAFFYVRMNVVQHFDTCIRNIVINVSP